MNVKDYCQEEILKDGSPVVVRAIRPNDKRINTVGIIGDLAIMLAVGSCDCQAG